jgi:glycerol-3-phosphate acyltransferase PlsY
MNPSLLIALKLIVSFLIGAVPFAVIAMWGTGMDITKVGSRNPGFNNVWRVTDFRRSMVSLAGDLSKGAVAVVLLSSTADADALRWALGLAAVAGHCWTPFLRFNGGKGVATLAGALLYLEPPITVFCLILYPTLRWLGRRKGWAQEGAISSMTTMTVIATLVFIFRGAESGIFAVAGLAIVIIRHLPNLREIVSR